MAKKKTEPKKPTIQTIKVPFDPAYTVVFEGDNYKRQEDGKYLQKSTGNIVKLVKG